MAITYVLVEKTGELKTTTVKIFNEDDLFKKCGFKKSDGFNVICTYHVNELFEEPIKVRLYGKVAGRSGSENKHEFPPPADTVLIFGTCLLIALTKENEVINLTKEMWNSIEEQLFGGFEDITSSNEDSEDELENVPDEYKTKEGYLKDGFVVDDDELSEEEYEYDD